MSASTTGVRAGSGHRTRAFVLGAAIAFLGAFAFGGSAEAGQSSAERAAGLRSLGNVTVKGPSVVRKGRLATYTVKIRNAGNVAATGVRLKVSGRGLAFSTSVADIGANSSRTTVITVRPRRKGKVRAKFRVTSDDAGSKTVRKRILVKGKRSKVPVTG